MIDPIAKAAEDFDIHQLWFYKQQEARRTFWARATLLTVIFTMLSANLWLTWQAQADMLTNVDQARLAQVTLAEQNEARLTAMQAEIRQLRIDLALERKAPTSDVAAR
jgi:hypothetical protein